MAEYVPISFVKNIYNAFGIDQELSRNVYDIANDNNLQKSAWNYAMSKGMKISRYSREKCWVHYDRTKRAHFFSSFLVIRYSKHFKTVQIAFYHEIGRFHEIVDSSFFI